MIKNSVAAASYLARKDAVLAGLRIGASGVALFAANAGMAAIAADRKSVV